MALLALIGSMVVGSVMAAEPTKKDIKGVRKELKSIVKEQVSALKATEAELKASLKEIKKSESPQFAALAVDVALSGYYQKALAAHQKAISDMGESLDNLYTRLNPEPLATPTVIPEFSVDRGTILMKEFAKLRKDLQKSMDRAHKSLDSTRKAKLFQNPEPILSHVSDGMPLLSPPSRGPGGAQVANRREGPVAHIIAVFANSQEGVQGELYVYGYIDPQSYLSVSPSVEAVDGNGNKDSKAVGTTPLGNGYFRVSLLGGGFANMTTVNVSILSDVGVTLASTDITIPGLPQQD
jgi:hypothetical protein